MRRFSMPRLSTLLITVAVAALAVVAIVFSVISSLDSSPRQEAASTSQEQADSGEVPSPADAEGADDISGIQTRDELVTELAQANLSGTLAIAQRETCRVFKLSLPYLQARKEPGLEACSFPVVSDPRLSPTSEARQPNGVLVASCREGRLSVFDRLVTQHPPPNEQIARRYSTEGCAPAWRSDGALTFVRGGEVVSASPGVPRRARLRTGTARESRARGRAAGRPANARLRRREDHPTRLDGAHAVRRDHRPSQFRRHAGGSRRARRPNAPDRSRPPPGAEALAHTSEPETHLRGCESSGHAGALGVSPAS